MIDETQLKEIEETYEKEINDITKNVGEILAKGGPELLLGIMFLDSRKRRKLIKELEKEERKREKEERKKRK